MSEIRPYKIDYWYMQSIGGSAVPAQITLRAYSAEDAVFQANLDLDRLYDLHKITGVMPDTGGA